MQHTSRSKTEIGSLVDEFDREHATGAPKQGPGVGAMLGDMKGVIIGGVCLIVTIGALAFLATKVGGGPPDAGAASRVRVAMDAESGEVFERFRIREGDTMPWAHPSTGERTMYPIEKCYWSADGGARAKPTYVILNEMLGQPGPTVCPDCGREVIRHNPLPPPEELLKALEAAKARGEL